MSVAFTPGPWALHADNLSVFGAGPDRQQVVDCSVSSPNLSWPERYANARLITAAPDMLQALREIVGGHRILDVTTGRERCLYCTAESGDPHSDDCTMQFVFSALVRAGEQV